MNQTADSTNARAPDFDLSVPHGGYAWWYVDALSEDHRHGLTLIAFVGSVFSPYYFKGRQKGLNDPRDYCSVNVCLYGDARRWTMTERRAGSLTQRPETLAIGPSRLHWDRHETLSIAIDELGAPIPQRVRGSVRLTPSYINEQVFALDEAARHRWRPIAPSARVEVDLQQPSSRWTGHAYFDHNCGDEPLEDGFSYWDWSRAPLNSAAAPNNDACAILYNMQRREGGPKTLALRFSDNGCDPFEPPPDHRLPRTAVWQMPRASQADPSKPPRVVKTLEDTPFYSRSVINSRLLNQPLVAVHESLSLDRFRSPIVQSMLPFRMPRRRR